MLFYQDGPVQESLTPSHLACYLYFCWLMVFSYYWTNIWLLVVVRKLGLVASDQMATTANTKAISFWMRNKRASIVNFWWHFYLSMYTVVYISLLVFSIFSWGSNIQFLHQKYAPKISQWMRAHQTTLIKLDTVIHCFTICLLLWVIISRNSKVFLEEIVAG